MTGAAPGLHGAHRHGARLWGMVRTEDEVRARSGRDAGTAGDARPLALSKHEAAGNDFLVLVDLDGVWDLGPTEARWLCDRRLGVGADGLLIARRAGAGAPGGAPADAGAPGGAALSMVLYNADGTRAEMSGNGIRCLVQAAVLAGVAAPGPVRVSTDAGMRTVELVPGPNGAVASAAVDMGPVRLGGEVASPLPGTRARRADVGNPHLVLAGDVDLDTVDLAALHRRVTELLGTPVNVEVVRATRPGGLALRVFERGVGETAACGTGSCAAAAVARSLGMVGDVVEVANPGGALEVRLPDEGDRNGSAVLAGPVRRVAGVLVDPTRLSALAGGAFGDTGVPGAPGGTGAGLHQGGAPVSPSGAR